MTDKGDCLEETEIMFSGVYKSLDAVKKCLNCTKYINLPEVQELLQVFIKNYSPCNEVVDRSERKLFIVLEGIDASGKTTIGRRLSNLLQGSSLSTPPKELLDLRDRFDKHPDELRRAYYALGNYIAACQVQKVYKTQHVVMDRFWHSTASYAIALDSTRRGDGSVPSVGHEVYQWPADLLKPDIVFFLSVSEEKRIERLLKRTSKPVTEEELKMKDDKPLRDALQRANKNMCNPSQIKIDSDVTVEDVLTEIKVFLEENYNLNLPKIEKYYPPNGNPQK